MDEQEPVSTVQVFYCEIVMFLEKIINILAILKSNPTKEAYKKNSENTACQTKKLSGKKKLTTPKKLNLPHHFPVTVPNNIQKVVIRL